jgi:ribosomal protein S18 acetylase RimI-like enzyme
MSLEDSVTDSISMEVMENAMSLPCGHSFSQTTIEAWLDSGKKTCPLCNATVSRTDVRPNYALRNVIESMTSSKPEALLGSVAMSSAAAASTSTPSLPAVAAVAAVAVPAPAVVPLIADPFLGSLILHTVSIRDGPLVTKVADMMGVAFINSDDVFVRYCWPDRNPSAVKWFFSMICDYCAREGRIFALSDGNSRVIAAALWQPPQPPGEAGVSIFSMLRSGLAMAPFAIGIRSTARVLKSLKSTEEKHECTMGYRSHWSLYSVAVEQQFRCRKVGSRLLEPVLQLADDKQHECFVDTATPRSEAFFERLGFEATAKLCGLKDGVPPFTVLVRKAKAKASASSENEDGEGEDDDDNEED